jgi:hypothetical protein
MKGWVGTDFEKRIEGVYRPKRLEDEVLGSYKHTDFGKRVEGVYRPKRLQMKGVHGWVQAHRVWGKG